MGCPETEIYERRNREMPKLRKESVYRAFELIYYGVEAALGTAAIY
jgi:hypothetical protein